MNDQDQVTDAEIECVFELDRDATDGPWNDQPRHNGCGLLASDGGPVGWIETASWAGTTSGHRSIQDANANAALIAHYRNVAPRIARDLVEARAEVGRLREERDEALARAEKAEAEVERLRYTLEQLNKRVRGAVFPENVRTAVRAENWRALWDAIDAAEAMLEAHTDD